MALGFRLLTVAVLGALPLLGCAAASPPAPAPCPTVPVVSDEPRTKDAATLLERLGKRTRLSPAAEALRHPASLDDVREILRQDQALLFPAAAAFARTQDSLDARVLEASIELFLGESELLGAQVLTAQAASIGGDLRIARANVAGEGEAPTSERGRTLAQLVRVVEDGNAIADALVAVAPAHLKRGADLARKVHAEAPKDPRTYLLAAEYHRLRGEWAELDLALDTAEKLEAKSSVVRYLKGMEQLERYRRPDLGAGILRELIVDQPRFVRAQAALVLMAASPTDALRELAKLRTMNRDHYLVMLLEPTLSAAQELWRQRNPGAPIDALSKEEGKGRHGSTP